MTRPRQSSDLNPVEMILDEIDHRMKASHSTSAQDLWELPLLEEVAHRDAGYKNVLKCLRSNNVAALKNLKYKTNSGLTFFVYYIIIYVFLHAFIYKVENKKKFRPNL